MADSNIATFDVPRGTPLADAIEQAQRSFHIGDVDQGTTWYRQAFELAAHDDALRSALMIDHVTRLIGVEHFTAAAAHARAHADAAVEHGDTDATTRLSALRAEALACIGDWDGCTAELMRIEQAITAGTAGRLGQRDMVRVTRLWGLVGTREGRFDAARRMFEQARRHATDEATAKEIERDLLRLDVEEGTNRRLGDVGEADPPESVSELLFLVRRLEAEGRYERAAMLLTDNLRTVTDPGLRFVLLHHLVLAHARMKDYGTAERRLDELAAIAEHTPNPDEAIATVDRLRFALSGEPAMSPGAGFPARMYAARQALLNRDLPTAERLLADLHAEARTPALAAQWHLLVGEVVLAGRANGTTGRTLGECIDHLQHAIDLAERGARPDIVAESLHLGGRVHAQLAGDIEAAIPWWTSADRVEATLAGRQETDAARVRYLEAVPDTHDEMIRDAHMRFQRHSDARTAAVLVARIDGARSRALLSGITQADGSVLGVEPAATDPEGASRWLHTLIGGLPRSHVVWLLHPAPDVVYHVLIGRGLLRVASVRVERTALDGEIHELAPWLTPGPIEEEITADPKAFPARLAAMAELLAPDAVLSAVPPRVRRVAVVAGGRISEVPLAALPMPDGRGLILQRFALSYLPSIAAYRPLRQRALHQRGDDCLHVQPQVDWVHGAQQCARALTGADASLAGLREAVMRRAPRLIRIDSHGDYDEEDARRSWIELAPNSGHNGRLMAEELQSLDLSACGTLVLGACETGMSERRAREERLGFVRAALLAGASAVVAARWAAEHACANIVLEGFQRHLRYVSRDVALQRAQLDYLRNASTDAHLPYADHPARWACWSLYGDAQLQTAAGILRRPLRRALASVQSTTR